MTNLFSLVLSVLIMAQGTNVSPDLKAQAIQLANDVLVLSQGTSTITSTSPFVDTNGEYTITITKNVVVTDTPPVVQIPVVTPPQTPVFGGVVQQPQTPQTTCALTASTTNRGGEVSWSTQNASHGTLYYNSGRVMGGVRQYLSFAPATVLDPNGGYIYDLDPTDLPLKAVFYGTSGETECYSS